MQPRHDGHIEDGRFGVTRIRCRCHVCYDGFVRSGAEALVPMGSIPNFKIQKILNIILRGEVDSFYPKTYEEWCIVKLHVCDECWKKSMSKKIQRQQELREERRHAENDPVEEAKEEHYTDEDDIEEILRRYEEIKEMIRNGTYIRKNV